MTHINYEYFFQLEVLHRYFTDAICDDFIITPSAQTQSVLKGNKMLAKQYGNKLFVGLQVDDAGKAFMTPSTDLQLVFFLRLNNPLFFNYTNLPFSYPAGKVYYFSNRNTNTANSKNFISQAAAYNNATNYHPGDIVADNTGTVYENIKGCKGVTPTPAHKVNWMVIDKNQYVSEADALQWMPSVSTFTFTSPQNSAVINVNGYDLNTKNFTKNVLSKTIPFAQSTTNFTLNLSSLPTGKYQLTVNGVSQLIYINDELTFQPAFAIVEIYNDNSLAAAYKLLNGTTLKSPLYTIDFLNRATIWKYILHSTSKGVITDTSGFGFPTTDASTIISQTPIPLTETPLHVSLKVSVVDSVSVTPFTVSDVACPSPQRLTNFINGPDKYACSEIFLNY
jgi:hypothetical protein